MLQELYLFTFSKKNQRNMELAYECPNFCIPQIPCWKYILTYFVWSDHTSSAVVVDITVNKCSRCFLPCLPFRIFPDLSSTDMVVVIVKGMNLPAPSGKKNSLYISVVHSTVFPKGACESWKSLPGLTWFWIHWKVLFYP